MAPLNMCSLCREDFASLGAFDRHMVGKPSDRTRGCLTPQQMAAAGWRRDRKGRWSDLVGQSDARRARAAFHGAQTG